jgi:hypothetical protein
MRIPMYTGLTQQTGFKKPLKSALSTPHLYQSNDTTHFSGKHKKPPSTEASDSSSGVVARGGQSKLYTAANDVRKDGFLKELGKATHNPNEYVDGDTTTLQALLGNHSYYSQEGSEEAASTKNMLGSFLKHPKTKLLKQDTDALANITTQAINLNDTELLDALTHVQGFDIKKLDEGLQTEVWTALGYM